VDSKSRPITAFCTLGRQLHLVPASPDRYWMQQTHKHFANRCLPLRIANQIGWFILSDVDITVVWNGSDHASGLRITTPGEKNIEHVQSHFGYGILTWTIPYLFRTPPDYNLYVRGPTNMPKDGICALDGVVETDWAVASFTMNWKMTCVDVPVSFQVGEPIAMIMPIRRGEIETFEITMRDIAVDQDVQREYTAWYDSRKKFLETYRVARPKRTVWQKHYFMGNTVTGTTFEDHQTNLKVREVVDETGVRPTPVRSGALTGNLGAKHREQRVVEQAFRLLMRRMKGALSLRKWKSLILGRT
jgi:hypothetical protein